MKEKKTPTLQDAYDKIGLIDIIHRLCSANKIHSTFIESEKMREILPIDYAWGGYVTTKVEFTDRRTNKTYADEWDRNDEQDRLRVLTEINKRIQDFNQFFKEQQEILGIEENYKKWGYGEEYLYPLWAFQVYCTPPTTWKHQQGKKLINQVSLDNQHCYIQALNLDNKAFRIAFNKMIYTWIINMLPKSFVEGRSKFISNEHLLYQPKLEFENWFQSRGVMLDNAPTLLDPITLPTISDTSKAIVHTDQSIKDNEHSVLVQKLKEEREKNKKLKNRSWEIAFEEDLESGALQDVVDSVRFTSSRRINKKKLATKYGCTDKTILDLLIKYAPHLLRGDDANYLVDSIDDPKLIT